MHDKENFNAEVVLQTVTQIMLRFTEFKTEILEKKDFISQEDGEYIVDASADIRADIDLLKQAVLRL